MKGQSERKKTTLTVRETVLADFIQVCEQIGLRRDTYLNRVLPKAISLFAASPKRNSPAAETISKVLREEERGSLKKLVVSLEGSLLKDLNVVCAKKLVLRDMFFEEVLRCLIHGSPHGYLPKAIKSFPNEYRRDDGSRYLRHEETTHALKFIANSIYNPWPGWIAYDEERRHDGHEILGFTTLIDPEWGEMEVGVPGPVEPTYNMSPFDGILFGDIPMKEVLAIVAKKLEQSEKASEESDETGDESEYRSGQNLGEL